MFLYFGAILNKIIERNMFKRNKLYKKGKLQQLFYLCYYYFKNMNIRETLLLGHSKSQSDKIVAYIGNDEKRFDELVHLFLHDDKQIVQRAAMAFGWATLQNLPFFTKYMSEMIDYLAQKNVHDAVKRNILRVLQEVSVAEEYEGKLTEICFDLILKPDEPSAIKAFAMGVLTNICQKYPELAQELCLIIRENWEHESPAFRSRGRKILKQFQ